MDLNIFDKLLGEKISQTFIKNTLSYLGFKPIIRKNKIKISVPSYRFDISIAEDLIEEVARVYGYDNFTEIPLPLNQRSLNLKSKKSINHFLDLLSSRGYNEIITFTFLPKDSQHNSNVKTSVINVLNPISEDKSEMRTTMMHGLLKTAKYNISRQNPNIKFFELGKIYKKHKDKTISEESMLCLLYTSDAADD